MDPPPVRYVKTSDGYDIAYTVFGQGLPLVCVPFPFSHLQLYWSAPGDVRSWLECMAERFRLVYYDPRGQGMSTRDLGPDTSVDSFVLDLQAVVDKLRMERFVLFGFGFAMGHVAIHFAARYPERVEALILMTCSMGGDAWPVAIFEDLARENWDSFLWTIAPKGGSLDDIERSVRRLGASITRDNWLSTFRAFRKANVEPLLARLEMPALVMHPRDYATLHSEESARLAARIPDARFILLDGSTRLGDPEQGSKTIRSFLQSEARAGVTPDGGAGLSGREVQVLRLLASGKSNQQIADELVISLNTVRRHVSNVFDKTGVANRTQAAAYARDRGLL